MLERFSETKSFLSFQRDQKQNSSSKVEKSEKIVQLNNFENVKNVSIFAGAAALLTWFRSQPDFVSRI